MQVLTYEPDIDELTILFGEIKQMLIEINQGLFDRPIGHTSWCDCWKFEEYLKVNNYDNSSNN